MADGSFDVRVDQDNIIRCVGCINPLKPRNICFLTRQKPGGVFDAMCIHCAREVLRAASVTLELDRLMGQLLN